MGRPDVAYLIEDESLHVGYRRQDPELECADPELSDYVLFRLWLARQLALAKVA